MNNFKPTFLYIKRHTLSGKLYFGKTCSTNPSKYRGSGKLWTRHIKKHGVNHIETLWYCLFLDKETITKFALDFSAAQDIVNSDEWLNLKSENGSDGGFASGHKSEEHLTKISISLRNKVRTTEHKTNLGAAISKRHKEMTPAEKEKFSESYKRLKNSAKTWTIETECGEVFSITSLQQWCNDNFLKYTTFYYTLSSNKFHKGFRLLKHGI